MEYSAHFLLVSTFTLALLHTLVPDHWLPFVIVGRTRNWSISRVLWLTGVSGFLHVVVSVIIGVVVIYAGKHAVMQFSEEFGASAETFSATALMVFGAAYALWIRLRGHSPEGVHLATTQQSQDRWAGVSLAVVMGISPCVPVLPVFFEASTRGWKMVTATMILWALTTVGGMLAVTFWASRTARQIKWAWLDKYGDQATGVLLILIGAVMLLIEH